MRLRAASVGLLALTVLMTLLQSPASAQTTGTRNPPLVIPSMDGRDLFTFYCASCHGVDGMGRGPVASALKTPPPDLTTLAQRGGDTFPAERVESFVTGKSERSTGAHGSKDMPVWGPIFRALDANDALNARRLANIVGYVESLQVR